MRIRESEFFYVPQELMHWLAQVLDEYGLNNNLGGVDGDEILVSVDYDPHEKHVIRKIHKRIEKFYEKGK